MSFEKTKAPVKVSIYNPAVHAVCGLPNYQQHINMRRILHSSQYATLIPYIPKIDHQSDLARFSLY